MVTSGEVTKEGRTLVLCFDGTANEYDGDAGIGTFFSPGVVSPLFQWGAKVLDEAFAWYLDAHVMDGYRFLMQNYRVGDKICIFGFSRGAYTARALAGALYKVGLLPRDNQEQVLFAYKLYKREDQEGIHSVLDVRVEFVGVWDTVASVGVLMGKTLPFTNSNKSIKTFRHALSLDEHRAKFRPSHYYQTPSTPSATDSEASPVIAAKAPINPDVEAAKAGVLKRKGFLRRLSPKWLSSRDISPMEIEEGDPTDVIEMWFSGCHSDVGGGSVGNDSPHSLANISLRWMVREVMMSQCGIQFEQNALARASIPTPPRRDGPGQRDALESLHDELKSNVLWWLLEIIPLHFTWQDANGLWHRNLTFNLGKGRVITDARPRFHATVEQRMNDPASKYAPKAKWTAGTQVYDG
ncbi:hypothetical protein BD779DRAFT_1609141 [Infundibulicybe gibba]|nr:hypothetical protein BD779DRAFT_1609141 [Infundibulicybe gibba]